MVARLAARVSVGTMAKVTWPAQDFPAASTTEVATPGFTRANFARFCSVSSSRCASTQAFASPPPSSAPVTAESMMVLPDPVGATPRVLPWAWSAARLRSTKVVWRGRRRIGLLGPGGAEGGAGAGCGCGAAGAV